MMISFDLYNYNTGISCFFYLNASSPEFIDYNGFNNAKGIFCRFSLFFDIKKF